MTTSNVLGLLAALLLAPATPPPTRGPAGPSRYLIYLHGRIVQEEQSLRPRHPEFGYYEMRTITETFRARGFVTRAALRPKSISISEAADRVVSEVRQLIASGVPADQVTVVGASMGGSIALLAAARLHNHGVRFAVLGVCLSGTVGEMLSDEGKAPVGRVLSIRDASDAITRDCPAWVGSDRAAKGLEAREIVIDTGLGHGFLYRPLPAWVDPLLDWIGAARTGS